MLSSRLIARTAATTGAAGCAAIYATGEGLIHACAKSAGITWPQPLALLDPALALISEMRLNANPSLPALSLVSSAMAYLAACVTLWPRCSVLWLWECVTMCSVPYGCCVCCALTAAPIRYFEHCTTQPAYSEPANAQLVRLHVIPLCLAPLTTNMLNTLLMRAPSLTSLDRINLEIFAICDYVSVLALLLNRVRQVLPAYLAPILPEGAYAAQGTHASSIAD